eukprot:gene33413-42912_t
MNFEQFKSVIGSLQDARSRRDVRGGRPSVSDDLNDEEDEDDVDEDIAAAAEVSEEEYRAYVLSVYDQLRGKKSSVSVSDVLGWDQVKEILSEGLVEKSELEELLSKWGKKTGKGGEASLDFESFYGFMQEMDEILEYEDDAEDDEDEEEDDGEEGDDEEITDEEMREMFDEVRGKRSGVSVKAFKKWDEVSGMVADGEVTMSAIDDELKRLGVSKADGVLSFDQFSDMVRYLYKISMSAGDEAGEKEALSAEVVSRPLVENDEEDDGGDEDEEVSEEDYRAYAQEEFDQLRGKKSSVSVSDVLGWDQ